MLKDLLNSSRRLLWVLVGVFVAVIVFFLYQTISTQLQEDVYIQSGVLTPAAVASLNTSRLEQVEISPITLHYTESLAAEQQWLAQFLQAIPWADYELKPVNVFLYDDFSRVELLSYRNEFKVFRQANFFISGNNIYVPVEALPDLQDPRTSLAAIASAVVMASEFNDLNTSDLQDFVSAEAKYNYSNLEFFQAYKETLGESYESGIPYPQKAEEYADITSQCARLNFLEELFYCEQGLVLLQRSQTIPPDQRKFHESLEIFKSNQYIQLLDLKNDNYLNDFFTKINLRPSSIRFTQWQLQPIEYSSDYDVLHESKYYSGITKNKLTELKNHLTESGWEETLQSDRVSVQPFGIEQFEIIFEKPGEYYDSRLHLRLMDTGTLDVDCIVGSQRQDFCDQDSLFADSGFYGNMVLVQKANYQFN